MHKGCDVSAVKPESKFSELGIDSLDTVELLMSFATLGAPIVQLLSIVLGWSYMPSGARFTGFCTGMLGDLIFLVSVICMKDSWRAGIPDKDKTELVTDGIYKFSRNPAFLGFDFMYIGVLLLYFNPLTAVISVKTGAPSGKRMSFRVQAVSPR